MDILVFFIMKLIYISTAFLQSVAPCHVCEYIGVGAKNLIVDIPFSVSDVPKRCELITYGSYNFDSINGNPMFKHDEEYFWESSETKTLFQDAIKSLVKAGIPVYTYVGYNDSENNTLSDILDSQDQALYDQLICPLIEKIKDLQLTGIVLDVSDLYDGTPDLACKISSFVTKLKEQVPDLKFGLSVYSFHNKAYTKMSNKELFDYTITNSVIDQYFIDSFPYDLVCTPELSQSGTIITCSDKNVMSLELLSSIISQSTMDQTKTIVNIVIFPLSPLSLEVYISYSEYCSTPGAANSIEWCLDDSPTLYAIGVFAKDHFAGIAVDWIESDDVKGLCQCQQKFPVTNTIFDGWDGNPMTPCAKLN